VKFVYSVMAYNEYSGDETTETVRWSKSDQSMVLCVTFSLLYFSGKMHVETACSFWRLTGLLTTCSLCACIVYFCVPHGTEQFSTLYVCVYRYLAVSDCYGLLKLFRFTTLYLLTVFGQAHYTSDIKRDTWLTLMRPTIMDRVLFNVYTKWLLTLDVRFYMVFLPNQQLWHPQRLVLKTAES